MMQVSRIYVDHAFTVPGSGDIEIDWTKARFVTNPDGTIWLVLRPEAVRYDEVPRPFEVPA